MVTLTPLMGMALPTVSTIVTNGEIPVVTSVGTLPQDWALYLNSNLMIFDDHDHSQLGKQISSLYLETALDNDINGSSILQLSYASLSQNVGVVGLTPILYMDLGNLFFQAANGLVAQITLAGSLPADIGGFFGDYVAAAAVASFDGPTNAFTFYGAAGAYNATLALQSLLASAWNATGTLTMPSNFILNASNVRLVDNNVGFNNSVLVSQPSGAYNIVNVVGDGSAYVLNPPGQSNNVPIVDAFNTYECNPVDTNTISFPVNSNFNAGAQNQEVITLVFQSAFISNVWLPSQTETFVLSCVTASPNFTIPPLSYSIISAKASVVSNGNFPQFININSDVLWWVITILDMKIALNPPSLSSVTVNFHNAYNVTNGFVIAGVGQQIIKVVVKLLVNYPSIPYFGPTV
jgi:hypothetical protein